MIGGFEPSGYIYHDFNYKPTLYDHYTCAKHGRVDVLKEGYLVLVDLICGKCHRETNRAERRRLESNKCSKEERASKWPKVVLGSSKV